MKLIIKDTNNVSEKLIYIALDDNKLVHAYLLFGAKVVDGLVGSLYRRYGTTLKLINVPFNKSTKEVIDEI